MQEIIKTLSIGKILLFDKQEFLIKDIINTKYSYTIENTQPTGEIIQVKVENNQNFLFFIEENKIIFNKINVKLNTILDQKELIELNQRNEGEHIFFVNKKYIVKHVIKEKENIQYILMNYIDKNNKESLSIFIHNDIVDINECEIKRISLNQITIKK